MCGLKHRPQLTGRIELLWWVIVLEFIATLTVLCIWGFGAIQWLEEATDVNPENVHTWLALGWCQKRVGRLDLAIQSLEEGLSVAPDHAIIYYNLAWYWSLANTAKLAIAP